MWQKSSVIMGIYQNLSIITEADSNYMWFLSNQAWVLYQYNCFSTKTLGEVKIMILSDTIAS